jgi:ribosome-associated protein
MATGRNADMQSIAIHTDYIKLDQFLKLAEIVSSGGEARFYIQENPILVNGEPENRRGRKLRPGDEVKVPQGTWKIGQAG